MPCLPPALRLRAALSSSAADCVCHAQIAEREAPYMLMREPRYMQRDGATSCLPEDALPQRRGSEVSRYAPVRRATAYAPRTRCRCCLPACRRHVVDDAEVTLHYATPLLL